METFIHQQYLSDIDICDDLINFYKNSGNKHAGFVGDKRIQKEIKDSIDLGFKFIDQNILEKYLNQIYRIVEQYVEIFPACKTKSSWNNVSGQIQYYPPGGGFKTFHFEKGSRGKNWNRHLVFMTYLNDVTDNGGTEFFHQKLTIQPKKGLTLIWPTDWTHLHRGIVSPSQEKYIVTGWFCFKQLSFN